MLVSPTKMLPIFLSFTQYYKYSSTNFLMNELVKIKKSISRSI